MEADKTVSITQKEIKKGRHLVLLRSIKPIKLREVAQKLIDSCLVISKDTTGTAFYINQNIIITCAHCMTGPTIEFINSEANIVEGNPMIVDNKLDVALIITKTKSKYFIPLKSESPPIGEKVVCIGNPSSEDLESKTKRSTNYFPFYISTGLITGFCGDIHLGDTKKGLGPIIHNAWTYWGHSGAPICDYNGNLVGMHNSWDSTNGNRHGVSIEAIKRVIMMMEGMKKDRKIKMYYQ